MTNIASMIDHTVLKPAVTYDDILKLCEEARQYHFASVCINPTWVGMAYEQLKETDVKVCTVVGFPLGATTTEVKTFETKQAIQNGATEIDMVMNIGAFKSGDYESVEHDIASVVEATDTSIIVKVILEISFLSEEDIQKASRLAILAGADFVKTSTGFSDSGATTKAVRIMRQTVGPDKGVKASGGIRDRKTAEDMIAAGASRLGASAGIKIVEET
ncbi:deoxyribose-phosphate aldolase [Tuberibacillus sp. Marseille-P3662]|uniref:deoxyribose-phosphate aldolase n=1 Tax=Tuberibacillus sp. Marseille-P3662 TaxID=1965358 RepID=UPI000A1CC2F6|nr:deoxyribose-phosphate aldolase [Tuberibacillus sp. Marseille-P3662]